LVVYHLTDSQPERESLATDVVLPHRGELKGRSTWGRENLLGVKKPRVVGILQKK